MIYNVFNQGEIPHIGHGQRSLLALPPGRKWIVVIDWSNPHLEHAKIAIKAWEGLRPTPQDFSKRFVRSVMKNNLQYIEKTKLISDALKVLA